MKKILLINPPIYDFSAFDYWLKPYGLLRIAGFLRQQADFTLFDFLDREHPQIKNSSQLRSDKWSRGEYPSKKIDKPAPLKDVPRHYRRYGLPASEFNKFTEDHPPFDFVMIQTSMTYWYLGVKEIIDLVRDFYPTSKIILGGPYAGISHQHAKTLKADLVINGLKLDPLWQMLGLNPDWKEPALWEVYPHIESGAIRLTEGCPYKCSYCSVANHYPHFRLYDLPILKREFDLLNQMQIKDLAFYDDALLFKQEKCLSPFLEYLVSQDSKINLHTPNALHARYITPPLATLMIKAGFKTIALGLETNSDDWRKKTGLKVKNHQFEKCIEILINAGFAASNITAYLLIGHPNAPLDKLDAAITWVHKLGLKAFLSEYSPIPGTPDGELVSQQYDLSEPLAHNKVAFTIRQIGSDNLNYFKNRVKEGNQKNIGN